MIVATATTANIEKKFVEKMRTVWINNAISCMERNVV
jgi:hypothetical protein